MTIDEAIFQLADEGAYCLSMQMIKRYEAIKLGIEALKRVKIGRGQGYEPYIDSLLGETEE